MVGTGRTRPGGVKVDGGSVGGGGRGGAGVIKEGY